jgi:hypothetical protein
LTLAKLNSIANISNIDIKRNLFMFFPFSSCKTFLYYSVFKIVGGGVPRIMGNRSRVCERTSGVVVSVSPNHTSKIVGVVHKKKGQYILSFPPERCVDRNNKYNSFEKIRLGCLNTKPAVHKICRQPNSV